MQAVCAAVVPAAGRGERVGNARNKLLLLLAGEPVLIHALRALEACPEIGTVTVVTRDEDRGAVQDLAAAAGLRKVSQVVRGGRTRQESVFLGLQATPAESSLVAVHDGARPLVLPEEISRCVAAAIRTGAALLATPVTDTLKFVDANSRIVRRTLARDGVWAAQTPQIFRREWLIEAHTQAAAEGYVATDDCDLVERLGYPVEVCEARPENLKITTAEDFARAERALAARRYPGEQRGMVRVGFGHDAHRLVTGRALVLGGVTVPFDRGLEGHSDADVILHALVDALLGAAAAGDIGQLFPSSDPAYKDADSRLFLRAAAERVRALGMRIVAVDATLVAQAPRIAPYVPRMRAVIAETLGIALSQVSVKATTTDGLGYTGAGEGMAAHAVATLQDTNLPI